MENQENKTEVIVVGAGPAGIACAITIARAGKEVVLIERGKFSGSKNMFGGAIYAQPTREIFPDFEQNAPIERKTIEHKYAILGEDDGTVISYKKKTDKNVSYSVIRGKFDRWMAEEAKKAGVILVEETVVRDLILENGYVKGVKTEVETYYADIVVLADGVNSLLARQIGMRNKLKPEDVALSVKEVIDVLKKGSTTLATTKSVTFVEGKNMRYFTKVITENFNITEEEVNNILKDETYLDELIKEYWFLTDDIKNKNIYYSLEGYLYPDTYEFYTNASIKDIFRKLLDNMDDKLTPYKEEIENSKYSVHEMMTLASIIELEAGNASDRKGVAGVFYNRLNNGWSLGSDVTTYYAEKIDNWSRDLKKSELSSCNSYNTRSSCMAGKLPVSPICNPGRESIIAAIEPTSHKYYYFVADKNGKTYFNETDNGHTKTVNQLKRDGLWIEYEN